MIRYMDRPRQDCDQMPLQLRLRLPQNGESSSDGAEQPDRASASRLCQHRQFPQPQLTTESQEMTDLTYSRLRQKLS